MSYLSWPAVRPPIVYIKVRGVDYCIYQTVITFSAELPGLSAFQEQLDYPKAIGLVTENSKANVEFNWSFGSFTRRAFLRGTHCAIFPLPMHIQSHFIETRPAVLHALIRSRPLATFIAVKNGEIVVNHMPFVLSTGGDGLGVLRGHLPKGNSLWQCFDGKTQVVAVFQGPECYISPSWYPSKQEHGKVVPTWNYVVAHAHGKPTAIHDPAWLLSHLNAITDQQESAANLQESSRPVPWKVSDAPKDYTDKMINAIVGIELPIASLEGKWKVSQNRPEADRLGVAAGLHELGDDNSLAMEALVLQPDG